jgi:integrase
VTKSVTKGDKGEQMTLRTKRLDDDGVAKLKAKGKRYAVPDPELRGHYIRITPTGVKSFWVVARDPNGKQHWRPIDAPTIEKARTQAAKVIRSIRGATPNSFTAIAAQWRKMHVAKLRPITIEGYDLCIRRMSEAWDGRDFASIERDDVTKLLDEIEENHGTRSANYALQVFSSMANWHATRSRHYRSPLVKGMRRGSPTKRDRILNDDELRAVWKVAESNGTFGALVRLALLTAQRQDKLASMKWSDVKDGVWTIATEEREKGNAGVLVLPAEASAIIKGRKVASRDATPSAESPYIFPAAHGGGYVSGWSKMKRAFDAKCPPQGIIAPWAFHDLRRTARSLMSRAGVTSDIAERVMGHAIAGVEGVYDRHSYRDEKADALKRLAQQITDIVVPPPANVRKLRRA